MSGAPGSRYDTILKLASGGMATVWVGTVRGALGFRQLVAIKKPHPHLLGDPAFRAELVAEARLASMIHHANVVDVRDVEIDGEAISLVMDYIEGASLGDLLVAAARRGQRLAPRVCVRIALDALAGLHAAHELVDERGRPVGLVHRDVSPQNILVGTDGNARVADFGVAKFARKNQQSTSEGSLKGKLAYMAPEYVRGEAIDRRFDVFAIGVVLWEAICGKRCFRGENEAETLNRVITHDPENVSAIVSEAAPLDPVIACALAKPKDERFLNAAAMAAALEAAAGRASLVGTHSEVAAALSELVGAAIEERRTLVRAKLANEPSVASLMGVSPMVEAMVAEAAPPTEATSPPTATTSTPRMEGAPTEAVPTAPVATPQMPGAPKRPMTKPSAAVDPGIRPTPQGASAPVATMPDAPRAFAPHTMASPGPGVPSMIAASAVPSTMPMTPTPTPAPVPAGTLASAIPGNYTLRSDASSPNAMVDTQLAFHEESGRSFTGSVEAEPMPARRSPAWVLPLVVGTASAALAAGVVFYVATRSPSPSTTATTSSSSAAAASSAVAAASASAAAATSATIAATSTATAAPDPAPSAATSAPRAPAGARGHTPPRAAPTPAKAPDAPATGTIKPPPPNPYDQDKH